MSPSARRKIAATKAASRKTVAAKAASKQAMARRKVAVTRGGSAGKATFLRKDLTAKQIRLPRDNTVRMRMELDVIHRFLEGLEKSVLSQHEWIQAAQRQYGPTKPKLSAPPRLMDGVNEMLDCILSGGCLD
ncbi:MAG: hypothetical protein KJT01_05705 [Gemmatimonadetes bacterium]|nr:hypothetical protein [Gemmatimonadota bacterium]